MQIIVGEKGIYQMDSHNGQTSIEWSPEKAKTKFVKLTRRDPQRDALRQIGNFVLKRGYIAVVMGISSLAVIEKLHRQMLENNWEALLLVEADALFAQKVFDMFPHFFEHSAIVTPHNIEDIERFLDFFSAEQWLGYRIFSTAAVVKIDKHFYSLAEEKIKQGFSSRLSDLFTRLEFEPRWILNTFSQVMHFHKAKPISSLFEICSKIKCPSAILVSSGPSLRKALPWLKKNQKKIFIACADSAYRVLHRFGITPHLIISLDSQVFTVRHFGGLPSGSKNKFPFLYADLSANPQITSLWQGPLFFGMSAAYNKNHLQQERHVTPGCDFLEDFFSWKKGEYPGDIQSGGSVSTSLFDVLRNMGFQKIYLVGQDSGFTGHEFHVMGTHHNDAWLPTLKRTRTLEDINFKLIQKRSTRLLSSIKGKRIKADYVMSLYRLWFEQAAAVLAIEVYNVAEDGVPIENISSQKLSQIDLDEKAVEHLLQQILQVQKQEQLVSYQEIEDFILSMSSVNIHDKKKFYFLERIGRKHAIKAARQKLNLSEQQQLQELEIAEKEKFISQLNKLAQQWNKAIRS